VSKSKHILFPSREEGWELWRVDSDTKTLVKEFDPDGEIELPVSTKIAFSSHDIVSWPLVLPGNDEQIQRQITQLNLEQHGLLGQDSDSWDVFPVSQEDSLCTGVALSRDHLPHHKSHSSQSFDVASRFYQVDAIDCVLCKKEQGRWVSILYKNSIPFYWEPIDSLESLSSQLKILELEFSQQQIPFIAKKLIIEGDHSVNQELIDSIKKATHLEVAYVEEIALKKENSDLNLVPEAVKLDRKAKSRRYKILLFAIVGLMIYAGVAYFLYDQYSKTESEIVELERQVTELSPNWEKNEGDLAKLNELDAVLTNKWPLSSFEKVVSHFPKNQEMRLLVVELQSEVITMKGVSPNINLINKLFPALKRREKKLGLGLLVIIVAFVHFWGFDKWQKKKAGHQQKINSLTTTLDSFKLMDQSVIAYEDEIKWVNENPVPNTSFQDAQTELQNFLVSTMKELGIENITKTNYQRVQIQISTKATEKQIYQWLVAIHQPQKMRILSYLKLSPPENDSEEINCQIIAEQFISDL